MLRKLNKKVPRGGNFLAQHQDNTSASSGDTGNKETPLHGGAEEILDQMAEILVKEDQIAIDRARASAQDSILVAERHLARLRSTGQVSDQVRSLEAKIEMLRQSALVQKTPTQWREYTAQLASSHLDRINNDRESEE